MKREAQVEAQKLLLQFEFKNQSDEHINTTYFMAESKCCIYSYKTATI